MEVSVGDLQMDDLPEIVFANIQRDKQVKFPKDNFFPKYPEGHTGEIPKGQFFPKWWEVTLLVG